MVGGRGRSSSIISSSKPPRAASSSSAVAALPSFSPSLLQRVDLKLDVGESGLDYAEVAKKEHLTELELEIRKLNDKVKDVLAEQSYQKQRELEFRRTSEQIHSKQRYWSIFEVVVMVLATYFQVTTLQRFFRAFLTRATASTTTASAWLPSQTTTDAQPLRWPPPSRNKKACVRSSPARFCEQFFCVFLSSLPPPASPTTPPP